MNLRVLLILVLCALMARPAQAEPVAAISDSLSEQLEAMVERHQKKADKRENADLRIAKKLVAGTLTTVAFTPIAFGGLSEVLTDGSYSDDGLEAVGLLFASLYVSTLVGFPLGVSKVDPHDSLGKTLLGSGVAGLGGLGLAVVGAIMGYEDLTQSGIMFSFIAPPIVSIVVSEASRNPLSAQLRHSASSAEPSKPQACRVSFGSSSTLNGGLFAVIQLRF